MAQLLDHGEATGKYRSKLLAPSREFIGKRRMQAGMAPLWSHESRLTDVQTWQAYFLPFVDVRSTSACDQDDTPAERTSVGLLCINERYGAYNGGSAVVSRQGTRYCATTLLRVHFQERTCTI
jgi:hypothetical protein